MSDLTLPPVPEPQGEYESAVAWNGLVFSAGMTPRHDGWMVEPGQLGSQVGVPGGQQAAGIAALRAVSAVASAVGGLQEITRLIKLSVLIACTDDFSRHSEVADGATQALIRKLGHRGHVARTAYGVRTLPGNACVEVELVAAYGHLR